MSLNRVTVDIVVPNWQYCDYQNPHDRGKTTGHRCRFCQEVKKRGQGTRYFCTLFDNELIYKNGAVERTCLCYQSWGKNRVLNLTKEPRSTEQSSSGISPKEVIKIIRKALASVQKRATKLHLQGFPIIQAYDTAIGQELEEWKSEL